MKLDLNQTDAETAWEFVVSIGGQSYETRAPSVGEFQQLAALGTMPRTEAFKLFDGLFIGENRPSIAALSPQNFTAFVTNFCRYAAGWIARTMPKPAASETHKPTRPAAPPRHPRRF